MSQIEIETELTTLSTPELDAVERFIHSLRRKRGDGVLYDDHYGVWTDEDQIAIAGKIFDESENAE